MFLRRSNQWWSCSKHLKCMELHVPRAMPENPRWLWSHFWQISQRQYEVPSWRRIFLNNLLKRFLSVYAELQRKGYRWIITFSQIWKRIKRENKIKNKKCKRGKYQGFEIILAEKSLVSFQPNYGTVKEATFQDILGVREEYQHNIWKSRFQQSKFTIH